MKKALDRGSWVSQITMIRAASRYEQGRTHQTETPEEQTACY